MCQQTIKPSLNWVTNLCQFVKRPKDLTIYTFYKRLEQSESNCTKMCTTLTYHGSVIYGTGSSKNPRNLLIYFWFASKEIKIHQEYLIFDTNGLIGSIGGSLGLFIGFPFHGALISILAFIKDILIRSKFLS